MLTICILMMLHALKIVVGTLAITMILIIIRTDRFLVVITCIVIMVSMLIRLAGVIMVDLMLVIVGTLHIHVVSLLIAGARLISIRIICQTSVSHAHACGDDTHGLGGCDHACGVQML